MYNTAHNTETCPVKYSSTDRLAISHLSLSHSVLSFNYTEYISGSAGFKSFISQHYKRVTKAIMTYGQESPGWISLIKLVLKSLPSKISRHLNCVGKNYWSMNSETLRALDY